MSTESTRDVFEESFTASPEEETVSMRDLELSQTTATNASSQSQCSQELMLQILQEDVARVQPMFLNLIGSSGSSQGVKSEADVEDEDEESKMEVFEEEEVLSIKVTPPDDMPVNVDAANQYLTENMERLIADAPPVHYRLQLGGNHQELLHTPPNHRVSIPSTSRATPLKKKKKSEVPKRGRGRPRTKVDLDLKPKYYQPFPFFWSLNGDRIKKENPELKTVEELNQTASDLYFKMRHNFEESLVFDGQLREKNEELARAWEVRHPGMKWNRDTRRAERIDEEETEDEGDI